MTDELLIDRRGDVLVLTLNRPERLNALTGGMLAALGAALDAPDGARAVLVAAAGRAFCSGADVGAMSDRTDPAEDTYRALTEGANPVFARLAALDVPVVTAVRGAAAGMGCSLALAGDLCVASDTAYFLQAFANIGLVPDGGASWVLPRLIGLQRAAAMMLLAERVPAATALDWGMIHRLVPDDALDGEAFALAERLARGPSAALGAIRRQMHAALTGTLAEAMQREAENQRAMRRTGDAAEGARAFLEKRAPAFTGR